MLDRIGPAAAGGRRDGADDAIVGRVVRVDDGVAVVRLERGLVRAGFSGALLQEIACDPDRAPRAGERVVVRRWPDRRLTVEQVLEPRRRRR